MNEPSTTDVAIVGYGPTSQTLALLLGRQGHRVTVIERWSDLYPLPRAVHFDHETARILQAAGAIDDISRVTESQATYEWRNARREALIVFNWSGMGRSGWPFSNMFSQPELERVLDRHVKQQPTVTVRQGWSATALTQDAGGVHLTIERGEMRGGLWTSTGGRDALTARWVIGCDGANSFVRRALGIQMHDIGFAFDWLVIDVKPSVEREWVPHSWQLCDPARPTTIVPGGPGRRRWEFMLLPGERIEDMNHADVAWRLLAPWDITPDDAVLERHAVYTFRGQWAQQWKQGRVMLAGDAAHLMPPFAGQGMCSGMRDSMALAWRLDAVLRGRLNEPALDSYESERSGHVREIIGFSIELGKVICVTDPAAAAQRDRDMMAAQALPGYAPPPAPQPRLGAGLWTPDAPGAGLLGIQAQARIGGVRGRLDDLLGVRFTLIARDAAVLDALSPANRAALAHMNAAIVSIGPDGLDDIDGRYTAWLDELGCVAVLARPDFYLQGGARGVAELNPLLDAWRGALGLA